MLENTVASSTEQREVGCIKKGGTRVSETALEPNYLKLYNWAKIIPIRNWIKIPLGK
jgi:hypothetical protein